MELEPQDDHLLHRTIAIVTALFLPRRQASAWASACDWRGRLRYRCGLTEPAEASACSPAMPPMWCWTSTATSCLPPTPPPWLSIPSHPAGLRIHATPWGSWEARRSAPGRAGRSPFSPPVIFLRRISQGISGSSVYGVAHALVRNADARFRQRVRMPPGCRDESVSTRHRRVRAPLD